jgi:hypothetical protein
MTDRRLFSRSPARKATVAIGAAAGLLAVVPGCAFIFSEGPPAPERQAAVTYFDCSGSYAPPIVDTLFALLGLSTAAMASARQSNDGNSNTGTVAVDAGFAALFTASAIYGYNAIAHCHRATQARLERTLAARFLPPPYGLPPWGQPPPFWPPLLPPPYRAAVPSIPATPMTPATPPTPTPTEKPPTAAPPMFKPAPPAEPSAAPGN